MMARDRDRPLQRGRDLLGVPTGAVVRYEGRWGVICAIPHSNPERDRNRIIDFWDGGREYISRDAQVDYLRVKHKPLRPELVWPKDGA